MSDGAAPAGDASAGHGRAEPVAADAEVHAAGGVVWRAVDGGADAEVLLVHRPRYDDWSFPKGKREPGESDEACAQREVAEEVALRCPLGPELAGTSYVDHRGRTKSVRYWAMAAADAQPAGDFEPNDEVDERRWVAAADAEALLTYPHDADVLASWAATVARRHGGDDPSAG